MLFRLLGIETIECASAPEPAPDFRVLTAGGAEIAIEVVRLFDEPLKAAEAGLRRLASAVERHLDVAGVRAYVRLSPFDARVASLGQNDRAREAASIATLAQSLLAAGTRAADAGRLRAAGIHVLRRLQVVPATELLVDPALRSMTLGVPSHAVQALASKSRRVPGYRAAIGSTSLWLLAVTGTDFANGDPAHLLRHEARPAGFDRAFVLDRRPDGGGVIELVASDDIATEVP